VPLTCATRRAGYVNTHGQRHNRFTGCEQPVAHKGYVKVNGAPGVFTGG
jgi:hypothetical protein